MANSYEWYPRPPNPHERIVIGIHLIIMLVAITSSFAGWRLFGNYDNEVAAGLVIFGVILVRLLPTARRLRKK
jgi:hypothetical protein